MERIITKEKERLEVCKKALESKELDFSKPKQSRLSQPPTLKGAGKFLHLKWGWGSVVLRGRSIGEENPYQLEILLVKLNMSNNSAFYIHGLNGFVSFKIISYIRRKSGLTFFKANEINEENNNNIYENKGIVYRRLQLLTVQQGSAIHTATSYRKLSSFP